MSPAVPLASPEAAMSIQSPTIAEITKAVCGVMAAITVIPETGYNKHNKYKYASDADILGAVQPAMAKHGLAWRCISAVPTHDVTKNHMGHRTRLAMTYRLCHTSGEWMDYVVVGEGADGNDKGVYKALTGAYKYLQRHAFALPTGDDPERTGKPQPAEHDKDWEEDRKGFMAAIGRCGWSYDRDGSTNPDDPEGPPLQNLWAELQKLDTHWRPSYWPRERRYDLVRKMKAGIFPPKEA